MLLIPLPSSLSLFLISRLVSPPSLSPHVHLIVSLQFSSMIQLTLFASNYWIILSDGMKAFFLAVLAGLVVLAAAANDGRSCETAVEITQIPLAEAVVTTDFPPCSMQFGQTLVVEAKGLSFFFSPFLLFEFFLLYFYYFF